MHRTALHSALIGDCNVAVLQASLENVILQKSVCLQHCSGPCSDCGYLGQSEKDH